MNRLTQNDTHLGMYGVQTWSAGPLYPAVIKCVERYDDASANSLALFGDVRAVPLLDRIRHRSWTVILGGEEFTGYATRDDAEQAAAYLVREMREDVHGLGFAALLASPERIAA